MSLLTQHQLVMLPFGDKFIIHHSSRLLVLNIKQSTPTNSCLLFFYK